MTLTEIAFQIVAPLVAMAVGIGFGMIILGTGCFMVYELVRMAIKEWHL